MRNTADAGQAVQSCNDTSRVGSLDNQAVGRLRDALQLDSAQSAPQRFAQLVQEKTAIAALEPELVIVNDNVRGRHRSYWPMLADARSIQPPARGLWRTS